jgi:hypothetical protein
LHFLPFHIGYRLRFFRPAIATFVSALLLHTASLQAQDCGRTSSGLSPLNDLGTGFYRGLQGGLYPEGSNIRPSAHTEAGLLLAQQITPLAPDGQPDAVDGKIVLLSIGMSNTLQEFEYFQIAADTFQNKTHTLVLVNGAQGGKDINEIIDTSSVFWDNITDTLHQLGLSHLQVQAFWFKQAEAYPPTDVRFPDYPDSLKEKYKLAMHILAESFPNARLCYVSSRIYGGYGLLPLNPEPHAYYSGWAVKRLIEDQMNGNPELRFDGPDPVSPWLSWGPYTWADGETPRVDGLAWNCPEDYQPDGNHPSIAGRQKVAGMLLDFFSSDATTTPWFTALSTGVTEPGTAGTIPQKASVINYPNPFNPATTIEFRLPEAGPAALTLHNILGQELGIIASGDFAAGIHKISFDASRLGTGVYYYVLSSGKHRAAGRMVLMK